jgi:hypothetical protein
MSSSSVHTSVYTYVTRYDAECACLPKLQCACMLAGSCTRSVHMQDVISVHSLSHSSSSVCMYML